VARHQDLLLQPGATAGWTGLTLFRAGAAANPMSKISENR
jgi:hypothetical protein